MRGGGIRIRESPKGPSSWSHGEAQDVEPNNHVDALGFQRILSPPMNRKKRSRAKCCIYVLSMLFYCNPILIQSSIISGLSSPWGIKNRVGNGKDWNLSDSLIRTTPERAFESSSICVTIKDSHGINQSRETHAPSLGPAQWWGMEESILVWRSGWRDGETAVDGRGTAWNRGITPMKVL